MAWGFIFCFSFWGVSGRQRGQEGEEVIQSPCQSLFDGSVSNELKRLDKLDPLVLVNKVCSKTENNPVGDISPR